MFVCRWYRVSKQFWTRFRSDVSAAAVMLSSQSPYVVRADNTWLNMSVLMYPSGEAQAKPAVHAAARSYLHK